MQNEDQEKAVKKGIQDKPKKNWENYTLEYLYNMSSAALIFPATFLNVFALLVFLDNIRGAVQRYCKRDQK